MSGVDYQLTLDLLDKTNPIRTVVEDLSPEFGRLEVTHTGVQKTNNAKLTLVVPPDGKFVRTAPILIDENAKVNFLIEIQIDQAPFFGHKFRCELGQPTIREDENLGEVLDIPMVAIEFRVKESLSSFEDVELTPKRHFQEMVLRFNQTQPNGYNLNFLGFDANNIDLPDEPLKQNWFLFAPETYGARFEEVINRLAEPPATGGVLTDFYYDFDADAGATRLIFIFAEEFGKLDSGVVIDPLTLGAVGSEAGKDINTDNLIFKNLVVLKCSTSSGTLPTELQRFRSEFLNGTFRDEWDPAPAFVIGDKVKRSFPGAGNPDIRFFTAIANIGVGPNAPPELQLGTDWFEDFTTDPNLVGGGAPPANEGNPFFSPSPWTGFGQTSLAPLDDFATNLSATAIRGGVPPAGFAGYFVDWNITRTLFDRPVADDRFSRISVKMIDVRSNTPIPVPERWDGKRAIVGVAGSTNAQVTSWNAELSADTPIGSQLGLSGDLKGRVAEFVGPPFDTWVFSEKPIDDGGAGTNRRQDECNLLQRGQVLKWDFTLEGGEGDWDPDWDPTVNINDVDFSSPFHAVRTLRGVEGATQIALQAIEATYFFRRQGPVPLIQFPTSPNGNAINPTSRGAWLSFHYPYPNIANAGGSIGHFYGLNLDFPFKDTFNYTHTHNGLIGWNEGRNSEDFGSISAIRFKLKLGIFTSLDDATPALGYSDMPMTFWAMDKFDRIYFQDFTQRVNDAYEDHTIPVGNRAPQSLYNSRIDELVEAFGHKLPNFDFFIKEKEFSGIEFDWRFVKAWGIQWKDSYDSQGLYTGNFDDWLKQWYEGATQVAHNLFADLLNSLLFRPRDPTPLSVVDHCNIAIDELHFVKELYTLSDDAQTQDPRIILERDESQVDYLTAKAKVKAIATRKTFFPQFQFARARGDVRMKLGQRFTMVGPRVPNAPQELVCSEVKHIIDTDGYFMEVFGVRKFVLP